MSVTTTSRVILPQAITLSINGRDQEPTDEPAPAPNSRSDIRCVDPSSNPATWPSQYRDVPSRKPINRNLDMMTRPGGANIAEQIFIATLLNGVRLNANVNTLWRVSGGKVNKTVFRYEIGGEW